MKRLLKVLLLLIVVAALIAAGSFTYLMSTGLRAREHPGAFETSIARRIRTEIIARHARDLRNPVQLNDEVLTDARAHYADHCAVCHANDGSGNTEMGRGLYPKAPDMRRADTQQLTDGELFYIIENGIRFTGMPGWGTGTKEGEEASWRLVHFIRHLPRITREELAMMERMNPKSAEEWQELQEEREFLEGGSGAQPKRPASHGHSGEQQ
jgi:mono/diheme cytochrome c family protein